MQLLVKLLLMRFIVSTSALLLKSRLIHSTTQLCMSTAVEAPVNPLLTPLGQLPKFDSIEPVHVKQAIEFNLAELKDKFNKFEGILRNPQSGESWGTRRIEYDFKGVVETLEEIQAPLSTTWGIVGHLMGVKNSEDLRKAHDEVMPAVIDINQAVGQSQPLFAALTALKKRQSVWSSFSESQKRIVDSAIKQMESSGVGLESVAREKFNKLQLELAELQTKFSNNVLDSTKAFKLKIETAAEIDGLPDSVRGLAASNAVANGDAGATAESGPWVLTLDMPCYLPSMQHLKNRELREKLYRAYVTRSSSGEHDNAPLITRILQIKRELANMLGYNSHADKSLSTKMAPSVDSVRELTTMLQRQSIGAAQKELEDLKKFALTEGFSDDIALWDIQFWSERLREKEYQFEEEKLRVYFPLDAVLKGLFDLATRLFGVVVEPAHGSTSTWNNDVKFFDIKDEASGEHIASFFLDPYSRPADKKGGAWMDVCHGRSKVLNRKPVAYLVCNGSPPVGDVPSLMTFREVETLFHEFGHGLQHMLTRVEHGDAAGINGVEWDAVELPSQFMENWCYDKPTLYSFAKHYQTGEPLPLDLFEKVKAAKDFQAGLGMIRQLFFGAMDMELHSTYDPNGEKSIFELQHELAQTYTVIPPLATDRFLCSFSHIFAGGYSAGYYSYKWAEVMSADAFGAFEEAGLDDEEALRATGRRFRETVLSMGGGRHPSDVFRDFRGRDPTPDALLRHSGLVSK